MRNLVPMSEDASMNSQEAQNYDQIDTSGMEDEEFVDAPDSQDAHSNPTISDGHNTTTLHPPPNIPRTPEPNSHVRRFASSPGAALIAPIAKYWRTPKPSTNDASITATSPDEATLQWQRRIESALIKTNAEMAALREQLDMQQGSSSIHSSLFRPFRFERRSGVVVWLLRSFWTLFKGILKHAAVDLMLLMLATMWMQWQGVHTEEIATFVCKAVEKIRQLAFVRRLSRNARRAAIRTPVVSPRALGMSMMQQARP